jgi:crotonobetainyl-CoA:carnitine CoA-transferase CaiB-like acyl-CoA transferase
LNTKQAPLAHLKVLDLSRMLPGAFCTLLLADLGADVLKVESPRGGDGIRSIPAPGGFNATHAALNRGKRSIALDLRHPEASTVLVRLVRWADVVVESHRPGKLDEIGLGYEAMSAENPRIVWCSLTGFGDFGPHQNAPGHDLTYLGYSGLLDRLADGACTPPGAVLSLPLAGLMAGVGILAALPDATRTGQGVRLDANMVDSTMWVLGEDIARAATAPAPGWGTSSSRNVYTCQDGLQVTAAASEPRTWAILCDALGAPELKDHRVGLDEDAPVTAHLQKLFRTKPMSEWLATPGLLGGVGPVNDADRLVDDAHLAARGSLVNLATSGARVLANPIRYGSARGDEASCALEDPPALGAHTDEAMADAGFTTDEIQRMRSSAVVS